MFNQSLEAVFFFFRRQMIDGLLGCLLKWDSNEDERKFKDKEEVEEVSSSWESLNNYLAVI